MNPHKLTRWEQRLMALAVVFVCVLAATGCNKLRARDRLNKGVAAYKGGYYDEAAEYFKEAKELDPTLMNARLYLATAYASEYVPGAPSEENVRKGQEAIAEYKEILQTDPVNLNAIDGIGSILFNMASSPYSPSKFEESKSYHEKHIQLKPEDPEPYYWIGVIDWTLAFRANREKRLSYNQSHPTKPVKDPDPLPPNVRGEFASSYDAVIDEGIKNLQQALTLRPDYEDAMAYLNLLYRQKADAVESAQEREALLKQADELVDKVKEIKQKRAGTQQTS
jgi:tetratricopeptide (TPR) repeat protein